MRGNYEILDSLFPLIVRGVHMQFPGWFEHGNCSSHRKDMVYYMMKVKIHKDLVWLGEQLRISRSYSRFKPLQKMINVQST